MMKLRLKITKLINISYERPDNIRDLYIVLKNGCTAYLYDNKFIYRYARDGKIQVLALDNDLNIIDWYYKDFKYTYQEFLNNFDNDYSKYSMCYLDNWDGKNDDLDWIEVIRICPNCNKSQRVKVKIEDFNKFQNNDYDYIQNLFDYLTPSQREIFLSGYCDECWNDMIKEEDNSKPFWKYIDTLEESTDKWHYAMSLGQKYHDKGKDPNDYADEIIEKVNKEFKRKN